MSIVVKVRNNGFCYIQIIHVSQTQELYSCVWHQIKLFQTVFQLLALYEVIES